MYFTKRKDKFTKDNKQAIIHNSSYQNLPIWPRQDKTSILVQEKIGSNFPNLRQSASESFKLAKQRSKDGKYGHFKKNEKRPENTKKL